MSGNMAINDLPFFTEITTEELTNTLGGVAALGDGIQKGTGRIRIRMDDILDDPNYTGDFTNCTASGDKLKRTITVTCGLPKDAVFLAPKA